MRALRSCDFCGEQAVGTFEVIPDELDPTEAERRRIVLCQPCKDTLQTVIEPLIERARESQREPAENAEATRERSERADAADGGTNDLIESSAGDDGSLLGDPDTESSDDPESENAGSDASEPGDKPDEEPDDEKSSGSGAESSGTVKSDRPDNYGQVLRLLRNREFPMTREEVVTIATSAYKLDARNVQAIIDEAIDRGEFAESNGQLTHA
jgi:hypothetical protein